MIRLLNSHPFGDSDQSEEEVENGDVVSQFEALPVRSPSQLPWQSKE